MVHGDTCHNTYKCEIAQNQASRHRQLHKVWKTGHHVTSHHRMRGRKINFGMDPHTDSADAKNGPETDTHRLVLSPLLQTWPRQR
jgi:hypothetical protein